MFLKKDQYTKLGEFETGVNSRGGREGINMIKIHCKIVKNQF